MPVLESMSYLNFLSKEIALNVCEKALEAR